jgi:nucleoside-diphosphate-sugar epimerase
MAWYSPVGTFEPTATEQAMKILVTGASGFVGGRFARFALEHGFEVRATGRREDALAGLARHGAEVIGGDLSDPQLARQLCRGVEAVVHCAGAGSPWGTREALYQANVEVTENMVEGCLKEQVRRLVYLSSASVYFDGRARLALKEPQIATRFWGHEARSKFIAEQKVFGAGEFGLEAVALRPGQVVGAGDTRFFPRLLRLQGRNRLAIIGNGLNKTDFTSAHNLNQALLASLLAGQQALGKAFNVSDGMPLPIWDVINYVLRQQGLAPVRRYRRRAPLYLAAALDEAVCSLWPGRPQPRWSRLGVQLLSEHFTLDISRARHHLGYEPGASLWAGLDEFCDWWRPGDTIGTV